MKNSDFKFSEFWIRKMLLGFLSMLLGEVRSQFTVFLCTFIVKNILEYAEIVVTDSNSKILNIRGHSNMDADANPLRFGTVLTPSPF